MYLGFGEAAGAFVFISTSVLCWFYWKFVKPFRDFPSKHFEMDVISFLITGRHSQHHSLANFMFHLCLETGKRFQREGLFVMWLFKPTIILYSETHTKILLNNDSVLDKPPFWELIAEDLGNGVATVNGTTWKKRRKMLNPAFRPNVVKSHIPVFNKIAKGLVKQLSEASKKPIVDLLSHLKLATLKSFCETSFGINTDDQKYDEIFHRMGEALERSQDYTASISVKPWLQFKKFKLFFEEGRKQMKNQNELAYLTEYMVREISNQRTSQTSHEEADIKSFSRILIEHHLKDPSFTIQDLRGEAQTFILASHDTTAYTILWCLFMLAVHPEIQERVFEELESVIQNSDAEISYNDLNQLKYFDSVIKETMRLYPVLPLSARITGAEIEFGKYKVPKNTVVAYFPYLLHRDPDVYPDPEKFDPERFFDKSLEHPWAYIAFAEGIRNCIGKNFAIMQMKIFLGHILRNFHIMSLDKREDIAVDWKIIVAPQKPIRFRLFHRKSNQQL